MLVERAPVHNIPDSVLVKATSNYITKIGSHHAFSIASSSAIMPTTSNHVAVATTSVAALMGVIAGYYYRSRTSSVNNDRETKTTKIPKSLLQSEYQEELKLAVHLAMQAGLNMIDYMEAKGTEKEHRIELVIETKSHPTDFCTNIDIENEALIMKGIQAKFPHHAIIGEENVGTGIIPPLDVNTPTWIIDPIDGTTNFSSGLESLTCVSIGYCIQGRPVLGVIYAPATKELYIGVKGLGAYRNGTRIYQNPTQSTKCVKDAIICNEMGSTRNEKDLTLLFTAQQKLMLKGCKGFRQLGSGCLDLCFVASGRLDAVYAGVCEEGWKPWDYCAGYIIIQEAGCCMETIEQSESEKKNNNGAFDLYGKSVICAVSKELLDDVRSVITS
mmetsp:Transcript_43153/g.48892  ORF Transcript_43153/g.48892 Transcript_43153/m.48892 type:complete len:386 (-) Transcript_43153:129-1286(-)